MKQWPLSNLWKKLPEQVKRLSILGIILVAFFLMIRSLLIPSDFGKFGHYRASAVEEIATLPMQYAGQMACAECHEEKVKIKGKGYHKNVACEICHGPAAAHTRDPGSVKLTAPRGRGYCPICHEYLPSRPTGFPQIVSNAHNPMKPCISCHNPHDPKPPETPKECSACHAEIAKTKSLSHHVYIPCTRCHNVPKGHKISPRKFLPSKPSSREFCGGCHAKGAAGEKGIPQVDLATHGKRYVCWQCHYPHLPEAH